MAKKRKRRSILWWFRKTNALIRDNHFILSSYLHSDSYINKDALYPHPAAVSSVMRRLATVFSDKEIEIVVGPEKGGIILAQWTAYHLNRLYQKAKNKKRALALYAEKNNEGFELRRGYNQFLKGKKVLIVEDIITSGLSVKQVAEAVKASGGEVVAAGAICNRGGITADNLGVPEIKSLVHLRLVAWEEKDCPQCVKKIPINLEFGHGREYLVQKQNYPPQ